MAAHILSFFGLGFEFGEEAAGCDLVVHSSDVGRHLDFIYLHINSISSSHIHVQNIEYLR